MERLRRLSTTCSFLLIFAGSIITFNSSAQSAPEYRQVLFDVVSLLQQASSTTIPLYDQALIELIKLEVEQLSDEQILALFANSIPLDELEQLVARGQLDVSAFTSIALRTIDIPEIDVEPSSCASTTAATYFALLATQKVLKGIFSALKFECQQTLLGENGALACLAPALLVIDAETATDLAQFCRDEQRAAKGEAILELDRNIGEHLNEFVDDTTTSSRATQDSLDDVQADVATAMTDIDSIQSELDDGFSTIQSDISNTLADLSALTIDLTDLIALASDIQFRVQVNQVDIEDVQTRTADLQESTDEIRTDTQSIIDDVSALQTSADLVLANLDNGFDQINQDAIAAALSNPDVAVAEYALPEAAGGQLETAREIVIQAILALDSLGLGDTSAALVLLAQADQAYNSQDYVTAYSLFALAYQSLSSADISLRN